MRDKASKIPADDAVPGGSSLVIELSLVSSQPCRRDFYSSHLFLDVLGDVLGLD